jgi:hypothetical protein
VVRSISRRAALKSGVALGAVCALGLLPAESGAEASGVEVGPPSAGDGVARRLGLSGHGVLRAPGGPEVVFGELGGLTVAVAGAGADEVVVGVEGGVDAPRVYAVPAAGTRAPLPGTTAELRASLARARAEHRRRRALPGPGRAEATHDVARCAALLAAAAAMLVLCARGQAWACNAGFAFSMAAISACA